MCIYNFLLLFFSIWHIYILYTYVFDRKELDVMCKNKIAHFFINCNNKKCNFLHLKKITDMNINEHQLIKTAITATFMNIHCI